MKTCKKCNKTFKTTTLINAQLKNLGTRKYCLECSPHGSHNTQKIEVVKTEKKCPKCLLTKSLSEFGNRRGKVGNSSYCNLCMKIHSTVLSKQRQLKKQAVEYKGGKCEHCNYCRYIGALEFHHINDDSKEFNISERKLNKFEDIKNELDKCLLLCVNCHREEHERLRLLKLAVPP